MCFSLLPSITVEAVYAALLDCKLPEGIVQGKQGHANRAMCWDSVTAPGVHWYMGMCVLLVIVVSH